MVQFCKIERAAMKLLEIKNNLVKLLYSETEMPVLGRFIVLSSEVKSYVAQFINLKSDSISSFAIAKLLFTFSSDGVVDNYDGSVEVIGYLQTKNDIDEFVEKIKIGPQMSSVKEVTVTVTPSDPLVDEVFEIAN